MKLSNGKTLTEHVESDFSIQSMFEGISTMTKEESDTYDQAIKELFESTGRNLFEMGNKNDK